MISALAWIAGISLFLSGFVTPGIAQETADIATRNVVAAPQAETQLEVYTLQYQSAQEAAKLLNQLMERDKHATIVAEPVSNSLFVRATAESLKQIREVIEQLDQTPVQFDFDVYVLQRSPAFDKVDWKLFQGESEQAVAQIEQARKTGKIRILDQLQLTTISNQMGQVEFGQQGYRATSRDRAMTVRGGVPREMRATGVILSVQAQLSRETNKDIVASINLQKSWTPSSPKDVKDEQMPDDIETFSMKSTLRIPRGEAVKLGEHQSTSTTDTQHIVVIVIGQQKNNGH